MLYSIIRAKADIYSPFEYFCAFCRQHAVDIIVTFVKCGWYLIEERKIICCDPDMENEIRSSCIGSANEQRMLRRYYRRQKPSA